MSMDDAAARTDVATRLDETLFVEAGAGTGKTTALVGRTLALVERGVEMRSIAAITFTEAAAAELRDRIRTALRRARARPRSIEVDEAAISTLHAFAQRLLAEHPLEAGLPPAFEVLDEIQASIEFDERWSDFVDRLLDDAAYEPALLRGFAVGLNLAHAARGRGGASTTTATGWPASPCPPTALDDVDAAPLVAAIAPPPSHQPQCRFEDDRLASHLRRLDRLGRSPPGGGAATEVELLHLRQHAAVARLQQRARRQLALRRSSTVRAACQAAEDAKAALLDGVRQGVLGALLGAVARVHARRPRRSAARAAGWSSTTCSCWPATCCATTPDVRRRCASATRHLLIDEFQDTDPLQVELAVLLAPTTDAATTPGGAPPTRPAVLRRRPQAVDLPLPAGRHRLSCGCSERIVDEPLAAHRQLPLGARDPRLGQPRLRRADRRGQPGAQAAYEALVAAREPLVGRTARPAPAVVLLGDERTEADRRGPRAARPPTSPPPSTASSHEAWPVDDEAGRRPADAVATSPSCCRPAPRSPS